jgi:hypothetical protein
MTILTKSKYLRGFCPYDLRTEVGFCAGVGNLLRSIAIFTQCYYFEQIKKLDMDSVYNRQGGVEGALKKCMHIT